MRISFVVAFLFGGVLNNFWLFGLSTNSGENDVTDGKSAAAESEYDLQVDEDGVFILTDRNYERFFEKYPMALVEFYAPWCGHCKKLAPEYGKACRRLKSKGAKGVLAKMDATKETVLAQKYAINGYPTLKLFKDGLSGPVSDFDGERDAEGIMQWFEKQTDPDYKPPESSVLTLTASNFSDIALKADLILVEFYAPWCGHCKKLAPEYEKAALKLSYQPIPIPLAKVDGTVETALAQQYQVSGYPTLLVFRNGRSHKYAGGGRTAEEIAKYMMEQSNPACREIKTVDDIKRMKSHDDVIIIGFFDEKVDQDLFDTFNEACEELREDFKHLFFTHNKDVMLHFKGQYGRIGIFYPELFWSKYEPKSVFFDKKDPTSKQIVKFVKDKCVPLVGHRTQENKEKRYFKRPLIVAYYTVDFGHAHRDGTQYWRQKVLNVAHDFPDFTFAVSDEEEFSDEIKDAGLVDSGSDVNVIIYGTDKRHYPMNMDDYEDEFNEKNFRQFMKLWTEGRVKPYIKSQPVPKDAKGPVKTLVGNNFDDIVNDETKDVFIEFYAPWCGHCKAIEPVYKSLAEKFKSEKNLIIAQFDATANDVPPKYTVPGFPTIYFAPSGRKDAPLRYDGDRSLDDMAKFLKDNAVASFKREEL